MVKNNKLLWILLIFIPPVGIIYLWGTQKDFSRQKKTLLSLSSFLWLCLCLVFGGNSIDQESTESTSFEVTTESTSFEVTTESSDTKSKYKTSATWALDDNYKFAVEIDSYSGDIFKAGEYRFYPDSVSSLEAGVMYSEYTPVVWDIYVSEKNYESSSDLKDDELVATVGGIDKNDAIINLKPGTYVYINYIEVVNKPLGTLQIDKTN